jgi:hypothetical protein
VPLIGASGAISGMLGFYFVFFPRNTVRMLAFLPPFLMQVFQIPARLVLGMYLLVDNLVPFLFASEGGVAHGAHISGFIVGGTVAWLMERRTPAVRPSDIGGPQATAPGPDVVREALADGRYGDAARAWFALPSARGVLSSDEAVDLATWLRQGGHAEAALALLRQVAREAPRGGGISEVHALAGEILLEDLRQPTAAYPWLLKALETGPRPETADGVRLRLAAIEGLQKRRIGRLRPGPPA